MCRNCQALGYRYLWWGNFNLTSNISLDFMAQRINIRNFIVLFGVATFSFFIIYVPTYWMIPVLYTMLRFFFLFLLIFYYYGFALSFKEFDLIRRHNKMRGFDIKQPKCHSSKAKKKFFDCLIWSHGKFDSIRFYAIEFSIFSSSFLVNCVDLLSV